MKGTFVMLGLLLCLVCESAQAKSHLSRGEIKIFSAASLAVVYAGTDEAIQPYIRGGGGTTPASQLLADAILRHQLDEFSQRIAPYRSTIAGLDLPQATRKGIREALASVPYIPPRLWVDATLNPDESTFMKDEAAKTKAEIVIFIKPRLMMNYGMDGLYMTTTVDIETLDATGKSYQHYDGTELTVEIDMDDDQLPPVTSPLPASTEGEDVHTMLLFSDDGAPFKRFYASLLQQAQQKLYYFFTGTNTPPPAAATHAS